MGSGKKRVQEKAEGRATEAQGLEDQRAQEMKDLLMARRETATARADPTHDAIRQANERQLASGGVSPEARERVQSSFNRVGDVSRRLTQLPSAEERGRRITEASYGRGREGYNEIATGGIDRASMGRGRETYQDFANTGGFSEAGRNRFLRSSTAPITSMYARAKDEQNRRAALGNFTSTDARILRQAANAGAEASTSANVALENQIRQGRLAGAGGLERTRTAAGEEYLAGLGGLERTREAAGQEAQTGITGETAALTAAGNLAASEARGQLDLELGQARSVQDAIDSTQRYLESVQGEITEADRMQISNRLAQLGMTRADIDALLGISGQKRTGLENAMGAVGAVGGATAGIMGALP